jgi:hypothetical protein
VPIRREPATAFCLIEPGQAIGVIAESVGRDARRALVERVVDAWVDAIPERELAAHYAKAVEALEPHELRTLGGWCGATGAVPSATFLIGAFAGLGERRRETLRAAACWRSAAAFDGGVTAEQVIATVLPCLSAARLRDLLRDCTELYLADRLGGEN